MAAKRDPESTSEQLDIRASLEKALSSHKADLNAAFSFNQAYPDAPNPGLQVSDGDIGVIGLPLNTREAEVIKSKAIQAPFGMGERTVVDTNVRDTWEIDGRSITFLNPAWKEFISRVVNDVCRTLGIDVKASTPRAELYKLLLYETGSHFLPHVDTEKADGMFATIVIVLPSIFTGGAAHLAHGGLSAVYDVASSSQLSTTALAWYTDVQHEIKPITSGYRLALSYNLIHTTKSMRPAPSVNQKVVKRFAKLLDAWTNANSETSPEKIVYLLDHKYSEANLRGSALKGADAHKVALLEGLAKKHGFSIGLATAHCHLSGCGDDDFGNRHGRVDFGEIADSEMTIQHLVDVNGRLIKEGLDFEEEETIPEDLTDSVESGPCDREEYEGYMGNGAGSLERWYRRTVLVIWPNRNNYKILYQGPAGFKLACIALLTSMLDSRDDDLADFIQSQYAVDPERAAGTLCQAAYAWNDVELWKDIIGLCSKRNGTGTISKQIVVNALEQFTWGEVRESFEEMLKHDQHNASRLEFLAVLENWAQEEAEKDDLEAEDEDDPDTQETGAKAIETEDAKMEVAGTAEATTAETDHAETAGSTSAEGMVVDEDGHSSVGAEDDHGGTQPDEIRPWISEQVQEVLKTLRPPDESETRILLDAAKDNGGIGFIKDNMLSQPQFRSKSSFLLHFASALSSSRDFPGSPEKSAVISTILKRAISKVSFFKPSPEPRHAWSRYVSSTKTQTVSPSDLAEKYVSICFAVGCPDRVSDIVTKVMDVSPLSASDAQECARNVMLPLATYCTALLLKNSDVTSIKGLNKLRHTGIKLYLDWICATADWLTKAEFEKLLNVTVLDGNPQVFLETVIPKLQSTKLPVSALGIIVDGIRSHRDRFVFPDGQTDAPLDLAITSFAKKYVKKIPFRNASDIINTLNWCSDIRRVDLGQTIIERFLNPPAMDATYIVDTLIPLLPRFRQWATQVKQLENLAWVFPDVMILWIQKILGSPPAHNATLATQMQSLRMWTCTCRDCQEVQAFLRSNLYRTQSMQKIGAPRRKHLEKNMAVIDRHLVTYQMIGGSPQGLTITKSEALHVLSSWKAKQRSGLNILNTIGANEQEQRRLLKPSFDQILGAINGSAPLTITRNSIKNRPPVASTSSSQSQAGVSSAGKSKGTRPPDPRPTKKTKKVHGADSNDFIDLT
ncbi:hypothetical protein DENSPDRAFT_823223 [Dentipellis sp. KUC8613]|nr:hypothetical protein DENSPDRAFT_823223 [Dentipellis sp. KUC8613]